MGIWEYRFRLGGLHMKRMLQPGTAKSKNCLTLGGTVFF